MTNLQRPEHEVVVLYEAVHGVAHAESVVPVVVGHSAVVLLDG